MQKSDFTIIQDNLSELWKISDQIKKLLSGSNDDSDEKWEEIENCYQKRAFLLENIDHWRKTDKGQEIILKNFDNWNKVIKKIADIDIENLNNIESSLKSTGDKLKELNKQRNLLLYNKESIKWISNQ